jgi:hypothetical protein
MVTAVENLPDNRRAGELTLSADWLLARVRGEYLEMPGLRLTLSQACRLWQVDAETCERLLEHLVRVNFLCQIAGGFYVAANSTRRAR